MIHARHLSFSYRGTDRPALRDVDLELSAGRWGLLLGPTGAGKSTFARCLNRSIPQFFPGELGGDLAVGGRPTAGRRVPEMAAHVGLVLQDFETQIFSSSCLLEVAFAMENRCVAPAEIRSRAGELLARVGLAGFEQRDPSTLSGGEKQRLVIAAVLAQDAPLLVLDEPASDLDPRGRHEVYRLIASIQGVSVLLVEHDLEGLPPTGPGTLLVAGAVARRWDDGGPEAMLRMAPDLGDAGVRPPPVASLVAGLLRRWPRLEAAGGAIARAGSPSELDAALESDGWRIEPADLPRLDETAAAAAPVIRCLGVERVHGAGREGRRALDGIDLSIAAGEMTAIIGANGSGKTTLARLMCGLDRPDAGEVLLRGREVSSIPARERAGLIGFVFQNPDHQIFASSVRDEVAFGPANLGASGKELERRIDQALEVVDLAAAGAEDPFTLTKGQRQRLALASVLACEPEVIIMDEPTTGLDLRQQASVMSLLQSLNERGHTIVIITHALWMLREPINRTLVMSRGRLLADGPPRRLLTDPVLMESAGLRSPDLAEMSRRRGLPLLAPEEWIAALAPPG